MLLPPRSLFDVVFYEWNSSIPLSGLQAQGFETQFFFGDCHCEFVVYTENESKRQVAIQG